MKPKRKPKGKTSTIRKILVPTDFSPASEQALRQAAQIALPLGAEVVLLHVVERFPYSASEGFVFVDHRPALIAVSRSLLDSLIQKWIPKPLRAFPRLATGTPHQEIIRTARREGVQLIVLGTHGRSGVGHMLLGSVAEKVVRTASCPVLTVRSTGRKKTTVTARRRSRR